MASSNWATIRSAKKRKFSAARRAWPLAWVMGRPVSKVSSSARRASWASTASAILFRMRARSRGFIFGHGPLTNASRAAATARSMSSFWPAAAVA